METSFICQPLILFILILQLFVVQTGADTQFDHHFAPAGVRAPPRLVCPPGMVAIDVQYTVCDGTSCHPTTTQRCVFSRGLPKGQSPSAEHQEIVQERGSSSGQIGRRELEPTNQATNYRPWGYLTSKVSNIWSSFNVPVFQMPRLKWPGFMAQTTPALPTTTSTTMTTLTRTTASVTVASTTVASTSASITVSTSTTTATVADTTTIATASTATTADRITTTGATTTSVATTITTTTESYREPQNLKTQKTSAIQDSLQDFSRDKYNDVAGKNNANALNTNASPTTSIEDDSSLPFCPRNMPKLGCKDSGVNICRKINKPLCGKQAFETCTVMPMNQTVQICHGVINKMCQIKSASTGSPKYQQSIPGSSNGPPTQKFEAPSEESFSGHVETLGDGDEVLEDLGSSQHPFRSKREAPATRTKTSCAPKNVSVCSTLYNIVVKPSTLRASCIHIPSFRCEDIALDGPFSDQIESCSSNHREVCNQYPILEKVPEAKNICENVTVTECYEEVYDASGRNLIRKTLKPSPQNEIVCKEVEARLCGDQSSVELVVDECSEEVKTSCQIGYVEKCAFLTKRTCKQPGSPIPYTCVMA